MTKDEIESQLTNIVSSCFIPDLEIIFRSDRVSIQCPYRIRIAFTYIPEEDKLVVGNWNLNYDYKADWDTLLQIVNPLVQNWFRISYGNHTDKPYDWRESTDKFIHNIRQRIGGSQ